MGRPSTGAREKIVAAAVTLLREHGVAAFSQPAVARLVGIQQGHLTYYFPTRSDLWNAIVQDVSATTLRELATIAEGDPAERLQRGFSLVRKLARDRGRTRLWLGLLAQAEQEPDLRTALIENTRHIQAALASMLGPSAREPDVEMLLYLLWGIGISHLLYTGQRSDRTTDRLVAQVPRWIAAVSNAADAGSRRTRKGKSHA